jgi:PsbP
MTSIHRAACALGVAALAVACASGPRWVPAWGTYSPPSGRYAIDFPQGWMRLGDRDTVVVSHDGLFLQRIDVFQHQTGKPIGGTRKVVSAGMLPQEVAEVVQDAVVSSPGMQGVTVTENAPASLDGRPGFKLLVAYKDRDGLRMKSVIYGALVGESLYELSYSAPERHYFDRDLGTFEQVLSTFRIAPPALLRAKND